MNAPDSPCTGGCGLDAHTGWCRGCARTGPEIAGWPTMADAGKRDVLERAVERRQGASGGGVGAEGHPCIPGARTGLHDVQIGGNGQ